MEDTDDIQQDRFEEEPKEEDDVYVYDNETEDEEQSADLFDELDAPLASFSKYCNTFMEKYGSRKRARNLRKHGTSSISTPTTGPDDLEDEYDFSHASRGLAVIINNVNYRTKEGKFHKRQGSQKDATNLEIIFQHLGFLVKRYNDLTKSQMLLKLQRAASNMKYNHKLADCFACAILSHGNQKTKFEPRNTEYDALEQHDVVYGVDGKHVSTRFLTSIFNDECCPELQGKPRLFFIQACRGDNLDVGTEISVLKARKKNGSKNHRSEKGHDAKDAVSSDSVSSSDSDSELESELNSDLKISELEHGRESRDGSMKDQQVTYKYHGEDRNTTEVYEQFAKMQRNEQIEGERRQTKRQLEQTVEGEGSHERQEVPEGQLSKETGTGKEHKSGRILKTDKLPNNQRSKDRSSPISPHTSNVSTESIREVLAVSPPPIYRDFLLVYAAPPGYFAWRNKKDGGWLIQALKIVLMAKDVFRVSFSRLLTQVSWKVSNDCESFSSNQCLNERKLVPCVMSMLTKDIYFKKKEK